MTAKGEKLVKNMNKTLSRLRKDVKDSTKATEQVVKVVRETGRENSQAVGQLRDAIMEMEISEKLAAIEAKQELVDGISVSLAEIEAENRTARQDLEERFDERIDETGDLLEERIRRIGSHIYETVEPGDEVEDRFGESVAGFLETLLGRTVGTFAKKWDAVKRRYDDLLENLASFRRSRTDMQDEIKKALHTVDLDEARFLQIETWCVELLDDDGKPQYVFVAPSTINPGSETLLEPVPSLANLPKHLENPFESNLSPESREEHLIPSSSQFEAIEGINPGRIRRFMKAHRDEPGTMLTGVDRNGY